MLKKIIRLSNVGRFERCEPQNGLNLDQFTIIYGDNGRGKTTFSAIMRSLKTGEARYILERCTLDAQGQPREPKVILETDQGRTIYENGSWLKLFPNIEIFDSCFTNENIFSGDRIEPDHRKSLYPLIIGERGVQLAKDFSELGLAVKNKNEEIKEIASEIQQYMNYGISIVNFIVLPQVDNIDEAIDGATQRVRALQQEKEIETRAALNKVDFPDITIDALEAMLAKSLADVFRDAQTLTHKHIDHCQMGDRGQGWLKEGLSYVQGESCPFCGQSLVGNDLLAAYEGYFNEAYDNLRAEIQRFHDKWYELLGDRALLTVQKVLGENAANIEFWSEHIGEGRPELPYEDLESVWTELQTLCFQSLEEKQALPLESMSPSLPLILGFQKFEELKGKIDKYNNTVDNYNEKIILLKQRLNTTDLATAREELQRLENTRRRYETHTQNLCDQYRNLLDELNGLEERKKEVNQEISSFNKAHFPHYQDSLNHYLEKFGADFRIAKLAGSLAGGKNPSSTYYIEIRGVEIKLSGEPGTAQFSTTLSEGDKTTLAFAFFLARLEHDPNLSEKVLVIDDPVSSLGEHRKDCTHEEILSLLGRVKQLILLSHDLQFLQRFWVSYQSNRMPAGVTLKQYEVIVQQGNVQASQIIEWDISKAIADRFDREYDKVIDFIAGHPHDPLDVAKCLRPLLEFDLRRRFREFRNCRSLGDMLTKIREASDPTNPLFSLNRLRLYEEYNNLNTYLTQFHHPNPVIPIDSALRPYARRVVALIQNREIIGHS